MASSIKLLLGKYSRIVKFQDLVEEPSQTEIAILDLDMNVCPTFHQITIFVYFLNLTEVCLFAERRGH